jgi:hypothetical protein
MPLSDHFRSMSEKIQVQILTVDPSQSRVEALTRDRAVIQVEMLPSQTFVWPKEKEWWVIQRQNISWVLANRVAVPATEEAPLTDMEPGQGRIDAEVVTNRHGEKFITEKSIQSLTFDPVVGSTVPNNSLYLDSADGQLKFKDSTGASKVL